MEQILTDRNISESDPLIKVANTNFTLIMIPLQYFICFMGNVISKANSMGCFVAPELGMETPSFLKNVDTSQVDVTALGLVDAANLAPPITFNHSRMVMSNYTITMVTTGCKMWSSANSSWTSDGCEVGGCNLLSK